MPIFHIRARNSTYLNRGGGQDYADSKAALADGVNAATAMVTEDIQRGAQVASVDLTIHDADDEIVERAVVTLGVAPMFVG